MVYNLLLLQFVLGYPSFEHKSPGLKLHIGCAISLSSATTPVWTQRCSSSGVPASTLRPHHWRPCSPPLAACTTTGRLQSCSRGISSTEWSVSAIPGSAI